MDAHTEIELKFLVPAGARAALAAELAARGQPRRAWRTSAYLDTPDLRLARAGLAWRMRREGGRWVQALKAARGGALARFEHEVLRPDASPDPAAHADTEPGRKLLALLAEAREAGLEACVRFQTQVRRLTRRVRTRGAVVDIALDEGRLTAAGAVQKLCELEFELVSGSAVAMLALAERWRARFGLVLDPRNKAERGFHLAAGSPHPALRKAALPGYAADAGATAALGAVLDECLDQIGRNAIGLAEGDPALRAEHVHQLRVGIRRLRSGLRAFRGWAVEPPAELVDGLRALFAALGATRDRDVLGSGVSAELARAGAPALALPAAVDAPDPATLVRAADAQRLLLAWVAWRAALDPQAPAPDALKRLARQRLRGWHKAIAESCRAFDELDGPALHELRKRVKRQRYALEFFAPLLPRKAAACHLQALAAAQLGLGEINDLGVARAHYQALVARDPAAWFAVGWLTARIAEVREGAREDMARLGAVAALPR
ncbi:CYTH and CHAD domain-containing protein [Pelomonas aquatica]|uniref:CYTH and CHAD domain-containing protein n=1 Tax=Pelomonas aquatica TaxID=431058 RepID=UPI00227B25E1|nr:CHAD domain-containing protein [Pelomonas aquatica]MCY4756386.1 CHAD domain-containing protein [Pelomonas aquatica]